jgi:hypothetical protein
MKGWNKLDKRIPKNMCTFFIARVETHIVLSSPYFPATHAIKIKNKKKFSKLGKGKKKKKKKTRWVN